MGELKFLYDNIQNDNRRRKTCTNLIFCANFSIEFYVKKKENGYNGLNK